MLSRSVFVASVLSLVMVGGIAHGVDLDAMRGQMLGEWEVLYEAGGQTQRNVKEIDNDYETMSIYVDDRLLHRWRCRWELEPVGDFALYKFDRFETLDGPCVFAPDYGGSYLLRVTDDAWYEVVRLEADADGPPRVDAFRRVGSGVATTGRVSRTIGSLTPGEGDADSASAFALRTASPPARPWKGSEAEWFDMSAGDEEKKRSLEKLALGAWRSVRDDGTVIEKVVKPGFEVVQLKRDGETVRSWKTDWQIRVESGVGQFWFRNYKLLDGERSAPDGIAGGYVISIVGDTWTEVTGVIGRAPSPPTLSTFKRFTPDGRGG